MNTNFHKTILNLFLCTLALIALTACGGSSGGGGSTPTTQSPGGATGYQPPDSIADAPNDPDNAGNKFDSWADALEHYRTDEYKASGGRNRIGASPADRIGAAYAYARGYTGEGIIIASVGEPIFNAHNDLNGRRDYGYEADGEDGSSTAGLCFSTCHVNYKKGTHLAGIMIGISGNIDSSEPGPIQGIAYGARIKLIDIVTDDPTQAEINKAIVEGTKANVATCGGGAYPAIVACKPITVMNSGWDNSVTLSTGAGEDERHFADAKELTSIFEPERVAWRTVVETTVVVFPAGDNGLNTENGIRNLYNNNALTDYSHNLNYYEFEGAINKASAHARLASSVATGATGSEAMLKGRTLTVIALKSNNEIWEESNGCGDVKLYCLGAPGVGITSSIASGASNYATQVQSGTAVAAAHVTGAVAVLKSAFNHLTVTDLVEVILVTADYIPLKTGEVAGSDTNEVYGHGALNLARATEPIGSRTICLPSYTTTAGQTRADDEQVCMDKALAVGVTIDNSGITLPTSFGNSLDGFTVGFIDDYNRAYIGNPSRITRENAAFTLGDTLATWDSPELQNIALDSNSKMQFTNYDENSDAKDTLIFTHKLPNHTIGFSYNEESKTPDLSLTDTGDDLYFQKIRPIASDLMQVNSTHKLSKAWNVKNAITSGEFDTGNRFNEAMANLNYAGENHKLTIGAGTLQEYGQFLGASGTGAYQLSDATQSTVTHLAISQNLPRNSTIKAKYTSFKTEVDMRYNNFAKINDLTADEYQLSLMKNKILGKNDSLNFELIQPFAVTDGNLEQNTVLGYTADGDYNNVTQNYTLAPTNRRQQLRMTWQNQINLEHKTRLFISMQYENHIDNLRDKENSQILGGISTRF